MADPLAREDVPCLISIQGVVVSSRLCWVGEESRGAWGSVIRMRGLTCWHQWRHDVAMDKTRILRAMFISGDEAWMLLK